MTRMDLTGPWATCIHVTPSTQDKYVGSQCDNRGRLVDTTPSLILDLLKGFWMNHRSYWCHHGLVSWILDSITVSDGLCRKRQSIYFFYDEVVHCTIKCEVKRLYVYTWFPKGWKQVSCMNVKWFLNFEAFRRQESSITRISHQLSEKRSSTVPAKRPAANVIPNLSFSRNKQKTQARCLLRIRDVDNPSCGFPLRSTDDFLHGGERLSVSPGKGIMSTILTLNYSDSCCSDCLRTMLWIKHKDQVRIRRKPLTSGEPPLSCSSARAQTPPPRAPTKLLPTSPHVKHNWLIWISKQELIPNKMTQTQRVKVLRACEECVSSGLYSEERRTAGRVSSAMAKTLTFLLAGSSCAVETPCNGLYFPFPGS